MELFIEQQPILKAQRWMRVSRWACTHTLVYILQFAQSKFSYSAVYLFFVYLCLSSFSLAVFVCVCETHACRRPHHMHASQYACTICAQQLCDCVQHFHVSEHMWVPGCLMECVCVLPEALSLGDYITGQLSDLSHQRG